MSAYIITGPPIAMTIKTITGTKARFCMDRLNIRRRKCNSTDSVIFKCRRPLRIEQSRRGPTIAMTRPAGAIVVIFHLPASGIDIVASRFHKPIVLGPKGNHRHWPWAHYTVATNRSRRESNHRALRFHSSRRA